MKKIGITERGGAIVELTNDEIEALEHLALVTEGETLWSIKGRYGGQDISGHDISNMIGAIYAFVEVKGLANELHQAVKRFDQSLTRHRGNLQEVGSDE